MKIRKFVFAPLDDNDDSSTNNESEFFPYTLVSNNDDKFIPGLNTVINNDSHQRVNYTNKDDVVAENNGNNYSSSIEDTGLLLEKEFQRGYDLAVKNVTEELTKQHQDELRSHHNQLLVKLTESLNVLTQEKSQLLQDQQKLFYNLIMEISKKIALTEISQNSTEILSNLIQDIFKDIDHNSHIVIKVNSKMKDCIEDEISKINSDIIIVENNSLQDIDCEIEWDNSKVKSLLKTRIDDIESLF